MTDIDVNVSGIADAKESLDDTKPGNASYRVTADTDYAVYVEFGTRHQEAQPFMRRAVNQSMREAGSLMESTENSEEFIKALAEEIADNARDNAPVDTGQLRNSIHVEKL